MFIFYIFCVFFYHFLHFCNNLSSVEDHVPKIISFAQSFRFLQVFVIFSNSSCLRCKSFQVDKYGTVQPHTLIRQHLNYKQWYDRSKLTPKDIHNIMFVSCMNPASGNAPIDLRLQRFFYAFALRYFEKFFVKFLKNRNKFFFIKLQVNYVEILGKF